MQKNSFVFVVCFLTYFSTANTESETVWLKDVTTRIQRHKRSLGDPDLPDKLSFLLKRKSQTLPINLKRNYNIDPNADIYTVKKLIDGRSILEKNNVENEDIAYYQDRANGAFMTARCVEGSNEQCDIVITGNIRIGNQNYDLRPAENDFPSRNVLYIADPGKRYFLQNQPNIAGDMPVEQSQLKIERNQSLIQDQAETDINIERKDNKKKEYHVKVLVILDSSVWDLFISLVNSSLHITKTVPKTQKKIRRYYSHIMNGVHQLYQGIQDPDIDINVKISGFVYLEWEAHFRHKVSQVLNVNGTKMINSSLYIADLFHSDLQGRYSHHPEFDQIILFTRYSFLRRDTDTSYAGGLSFPGYVCVPGYRVEIVESTDYFTTTYIAAHELGHSLGAVHDGEGEAISCKAEDGYIMTPGIPVFDSNKLYSKNPWLFSTCSVEAFKKTLANKDCVTRKPVYNEAEIDEWNKFMNKLPGQKYTYSEQCELTFGRGYTYCGEVHENICRFMYCMNTKTSICMTTPVSAAPGTTCGTNKWCQQGLCVAIK